MTALLIIFLLFLIGSLAGIGLIYALQFFFAHALGLRQAKRLLDGTEDNQ